MEDLLVLKHGDTKLQQGTCYKQKVDLEREKKYWSNASVWKIRFIENAPERKKNSNKQNLLLL